MVAAMLAMTLRLITGHLRFFSLDQVSLLMFVMPVDSLEEVAYGNHDGNQGEDQEGEDLADVFSYGSDDADDGDAGWDQEEADVFDEQLREGSHEVVGDDARLEGDEQEDHAQNWSWDEAQEVLVDEVSDFKVEEEDADGEEDVFEHEDDLPFNFHGSSVLLSVKRSDSI